MSELLDLATSVAGAAKAGEQVEAYVVRGTELSIRASGGEVEQLSSATSEGVGLRVVRDGRVGVAWAGSLDPEIVRDALADARDNAEFATPDEHAGLASPDGVTAPVLDLWRDDVGTTPTADKVALALELERQILAGDRIRALRHASYEDGRSELAVATSTGIAAESRETYAYVSAMAMAGEGDGTTTGGGLSFGRAFGDVVVEEAAAEAILTATRMLGASKPTSGDVTIVLDPKMAATFLSLVAGLCNGESVLKGRSLFAGRLGEEVAAPGFTLVEDPTVADAFGASAVDAEGLASRRTPLIEQGRLASYLYDTRWARAAGAASTASAARSFKGAPSIAARAVAPTPGTLDQAGVLGAVGTGLYVQSMSGLHSGVDPVSGDFSVGCEGLLIEGGQLGRPVKECTIASTLQRMLHAVAHVGSDLVWGPGRAAQVTLAIGDVRLSGA